MPLQKRKQTIAQVKKVVIKLGSNVLAMQDGRLNVRLIRSICDQICDLKADGYTIVVVSSGAIAAGIGELGLMGKALDLPLLQAAAAVGQLKLMACYDDALGAGGLHAAQMLLTREDFENRMRYLNARNTLWALLEMNAIPIINENDTIAVDEIKFGDNDVISALVTHLLQADLLILLSDVDGLYESRRSMSGRKILIEMIENFDQEVLSMATNERSSFGTGGMASKLDAVDKAIEAGVPAVIANGRKRNVLLRILRGEKEGTLFISSSPKMKSWKRWLGFAARPRGRIIVDQGAREALVRRGRSLLASGITGVHGEFEKGDIVIIDDDGGNSFARGLTNYSAVDIRKIMGKHTREFTKILGYASFDEVIHRNNLVILPLPSG